MLRFDIKSARKCLDKGKSLINLIGSWDSSLHVLQPVHDSKIQRLNVTIQGTKYSYLGYYCNPEGSAIGLAMTNDLWGKWHRYSGNPILGSRVRCYFIILLNHYRWPSVTYCDGMFHMFYCDRYGRKLKRAVSMNPFFFSDVETIETGEMYYNPFIWRNPNDGRWYLYYHLMNPFEKIVCKSATSIKNLGKVSPIEVLSIRKGGRFHVCASPSITYFDSIYYMAVESVDENGKWIIRIYSSKSPTGPFRNEGVLPLKGRCACPMLMLGSDENVVYCFFNCEYFPRLWDQYVMRSIKT